MRWKVTLIGGFVYWLVTFVVSFATGPLIHERLLDPIYRANEAFWRPELNQNPPDMAAVMPHWILAGIFGGLVTAGIYGCVRGSFAGPGWRRGLTYGICLAFLYTAANLGWSGIFGLPLKLWLWWSAEGFIYYLIGGAVLGWLAERLDPLHQG